MKWVSSGGPIRVEIRHRPSTKNIVVRLIDGDDFAEVSMDYVNAESVADGIYYILERETKKMRL